MSIDETRADRECLLALDLGTTNVKAVVVGLPSLESSISYSQSVGVSFPNPGWVEQDAGEIWEAARQVLADCFEAADERGYAVRGISISNQREAVAIWEAGTMAPLGPVLGWQDTRTTEQCQLLCEQGWAEPVRQATGLNLDPMFSASKMSWLLDSLAGQRADTTGVHVGTIDSWIIENLTGKFVTEAGNASRTLLYDIHQLQRREEFLEIFGVPASVLPPVERSDGDFGETKARDGIPGGVPVLAVMADSHSALYYHSRGNLGEGKATFGTGSSVMVPVAGSTVGSSGVATTVAWLSDHPVYGREGNVLATGAAISWMANLLFAGSPKSLDQAALQSTSKGKVRFIPAFSGLGAPYFARDAVGLVSGISGGTEPADLAWAALDAVAQQVADVVEAIMTDGDIELSVLHADGGATASDVLMQLQADLLGRPVHVAAVHMASAMGAALMAARKLGIENDSKQAGATRVISPRCDDSWRREQRQQWKEAVSRSMYRP